VNRFHRITPPRLGVALLVVVLAVFGSLTGATFALGQSHASHQSQASSSLPCQFGGDTCINIGFTEAWLNGQTVDLGYSHDFFCQEPPASAAASDCEAGSQARVQPPSGEVGAPVWVLIPKGFTPDPSTLHCPQAGMCIDHPDTIDLSRVGGSATATFPAHSVLIDDDEELNSVWWPAKIVFVTSQDGWDTLVAGQSLATLRQVQHAGEASRDFDTNLFIWFEVFTPEG